MAKLGIDPTVDYAFKLLFGNPLEPEPLIKVINAVRWSEPPIEEVTILNPFNDKEFAEDKLSVLDIKARDKLGHWFNIEMQSKAGGAMPQRLAYYNASLFVAQLGEGDRYHQLLPAITICFLKETLFSGTATPHQQFGLYDPASRRQLTNMLQIHTIELPKYNWEVGSLAAADPLAQWAFFLSHAAEYEPAELKRLLPQPEFLKATDVMETIAHTPEQRMLYEARRKAELDLRSSLYEAHASGLEEGLEKGREKGERQALSKQIALLQSLLGESVSPPEALDALDLPALRTLCETTARRLHDR